MNKMQPHPFDALLRTKYHGDREAFLNDLKKYANNLELDIAAEQRSTVPRPSFDGQPVIIDLKNISRIYKLNRKNQVPAVRNVNMQVHQGEIVALTGPSGSGKSTLLHLIGGLDTPTEGDIVVDGQHLKKLSDAKLARYRNKTVGFVFQFFYLQPFLRLQKNVEVPLMFARTKLGTRHAAVNQVVDAVGLAERSSHKPQELSGGQMQRVAIARALVNQPKILLADEPTGNLDSTNSQNILELLHKIRDDFGTTMVIVTHDPTVARWADRIIRLEDGKVLA